MKNKYFKCRDNTYYTKYTKEEIYSMGIPGDFNSYLPFLEDMNYLAWEKGYNQIYQNYLKNNKDPKRAFGNYIARIRLAAFRPFTFKDKFDF